MHARLPALSISLCLAGAAAAPAHDYWLEPSSSRPAAGEAVAISMRVGERLVGDPVPRNPFAVARFELIDPRGRATPAPGGAGMDPAALVRPVAPGLHWVLYQSRRSGLELPPEKFDEYLRLEGLEHVLDERKELRESALVAREAFSRSAKAALCAGGAGGGALAPQGLTLELVAESDPCSWRAGAEVPLHVLFRDEPLAGVLVQALRRDAPGAPAVGPAVAARTDRHGRVTLRLDGAGFWLVKAVAMERAEALPDVEWESFWASLTFELPPAP